MAQRCKYCHSKFIPVFFNQKDCGKEICRDKFVKETLEKAKKKREKDAKKEQLTQRKNRKIEKDNIKTLGQWKNTLQPLINQIARLIDYGQPCIATGSYVGKMNGGHCIAVGANSTLRYNLHNIHIQSEHSNSYKGGDSIRYKQGIEKVYGKDYLEFIESLHALPEINLSIINIQQVMPIVRTIIKELKDREQIYNPEERMELREQLNERIGIYK